MQRRAGFDPVTGAYVDTRVARGFPMGGIGAGGFSVASDGGFGELRLNNNWMSPIHGVRGAFHALWTRRSGATRCVMLRRSLDGDEYANASPVRGTTFTGTLPSFALAFDDDLPLSVTLHGLTPHVPHDVRESTLPAALFRFVLQNPGDEPVEASVLFSFENVLGRGGTGHLGVELGPEHEMKGVHRRVEYDSIAGAWQEEAAVGDRRGVRFRTDQVWDARSHRRGVTGQYLLLADATPDVAVTACDGWDAGAPSASVLDDFAREGHVRSTAPGRRGEDGGWRPAAAVAAATTVPAHATREVTFVLAWWTPDHVTEPSLARHRGEGPHDGTRVGHVYETHFDGVDAVATHVLDDRRRLEAASSELGALLEASSLPPWLVRAIRNSIDSTLCNTVVPANGRMYTLEGLDWHWPMGGLTGTNDQRLSSHPYTATFFPELDLSELDEFRRLADARGAIPHGNGNCDLGLGTTEIPYGWPMFIKDFLPAKEWTDLTMSLILQVGRAWRTTGRDDVLDRFWPAMVRGLDYLDSIAPDGVPEGGTTYDVWDFPGAFVYSATLYLATLRVMLTLGATRAPERCDVWQARFDRCAQRLDRDLWDPRGFFRSSEHKDTVFTAALAGEWAVRWAGFDPILDLDRARSHLVHQYRVLVTHAEGGLPRSEATFEGIAVDHPFRAGLPRGEEFTYVWQVVSYQACLQLYLGEVEAGLETLRRFYDRLWGDGFAWSGGLRGNAESVYMTHPVAWAVLAALTGAALDVPGRTLHLAPQGRLRCPVFFPSFWAICDHAPATEHTTLEVVRTFGDPVTIERVVEGGVREHTIGATVLATGARIELRP
ncbi:MAG TPA: GH116 family glycosyl-hydrolase [Candidatus Binatia bacterium]|jgi:uncharacterized protein (DUF608 family)|nr:GH116 family glycosyl-hydrolase [Candidatus Binatia bacterium]